MGNILNQQTCRKQLNKAAFDELQKEEDQRKEKGDYDFMIFNDRPEDIPPKPGIIGLMIAAALWIGIVIGIWALI